MQGFDYGQRVRSRRQWFAQRRRLVSSALVVFSKSKTNSPGLLFFGRPRIEWPTRFVSSLRPSLPYFGTKPKSVLADACPNARLNVLHRVEAVPVQSSLSGRPRRSRAFGLLSERNRAPPSTGTNPPVAEMITKVRQFSFEMPLTVFYRLFPIELKPSPALLFALFGGGTAADLASQAPYGRHGSSFRCAARIFPTTPPRTSASNSVFSNLQG
jgi:hypothetical protein